MTLLHAGRRLEEARTLLAEAIAVFALQGDHRLEGASRTYAAHVAWLLGDLVEAERQGGAAARVLAEVPPMLAGALATLARVQLAAARPAAALVTARAAYALLERLGSIEESEANVGIAYAEALLAAGEPAAEVLAGARAKLLARAARITDAAWRARFLAGVPDHARLLTLAGALCW